MSSAIGSMVDTAFKVHELNLWYGKNQALYDIELEIAKREVTAIIGPSGCGKSTFLKTLNLMARRVPNLRMTGEINFQGKNLLSEKTDLVELRKEIGMIFQKGNPFPQSIYDNVAFGPRIHGLRNKKELDTIVQDSLTKAALWDEVKDRLKDSALALSGGQMQRLCIARAIATNPEVILMDEPTSALDPNSTNRVEDLILELKEKFTIVIVTHNMQQAARISDRTAFFLNGKVIETGETDKIFSNPEERATEEYISGRFG
ncbi:phosphate ABC transporter ATP-binding protein PstB [Aciduricibacillus chroicocephali]|uniref:Phosphate ABC transporter ATP-binding protein PstB n=1 Tax=Aciduricibacillus chroicocephali TaxID=3054939 RepID=A0ABY9KTH9_9BACI|nr:phosphate ABC transporter ATP-binding protein PstB [Bacillaceae bacterium 44XB]